MTARALAILVAGGLAMLVADAAAGQDAPSTIVQSTVVVDGQVVIDAVTSSEQSGLTVSPVRETDAEAVRQDAEELLENDGLTPLHQPRQPVETFVDVENVVVRTDTPKSTACVQIGVVGAKPKCRPRS